MKKIYFSLLIILAFFFLISCDSSGGGGRASTTTPDFTSDLTEHYDTILWISTQGISLQIAGDNPDATLEIDGDIAHPYNVSYMKKMTTLIINIVTTQIPVI